MEKPLTLARRRELRNECNATIGEAALRLVEIEEVLEENSVVFSRFTESDLEIDEPALVS